MIEHYQSVDIHDLVLGPGGNTTARVSLEHFLTDEEAKEFTIEKVFLETPGWIDLEYKY